MSWYKPEVVWQTQVSDWARAYREIEEPLLSYTLWNATPHQLRWPHSVSTLEFIIAHTGDEHERVRCEEALRQLQQGGRNARGGGSAASVQPGTGQQGKGGKGKGRGKGWWGKGGKQ